MSTRLEKCEPKDATHVLMADGEQVYIAEKRNCCPGDLCLRLVNSDTFVSAEAVWCLRGSFVRFVDDTPGPCYCIYDVWEGRHDFRIPERFIGHCIRVSVEVQP